MQRRWLVSRTNPEYVSYLSRTAEIPRTLAQILINRGIKTAAEAEDFFSVSLDSMCDPMGIAGVPEAVRAIVEAARSGKRVLVHGDYDVDGVTSTAMLIEALRTIGLDVSCFIPNRFNDGYGFNPPAVALARKAGAGLIITADCGISSHEAIALARKEGIEVIVTDHHEPLVDESGEPVLPEALAIINPKLSNPEAANLSGAGVVFKLIQALAAADAGRLRPEDFLDLAALGTFADSVPLTGENRALAREGLVAIQHTSRPGLRALKEVAGLNGRQMRAGLLSFTIVPRLNAAGRVSDATEALELLLSRTEEEAMETASSLDGKNSERQKIEETVFREALQLVDRKGAGNAIVVAGRGWHEGVVGIVASKLAERFSRPAFVLSIDGELARGSARSIPQFDVFEGLEQCREFLVSFGGHRQAAGLRVEVSRLDSFERMISEAVAGAVDDFTPTLEIDAAVNLEEINFSLVNELARLEPFGAGNAEPVLGSRELTVLNPRVVGSRHLKLKLRSNSTVVDAIGFGMGQLCPMAEECATMDAAFAATINEWDGGKSLQLNLKAIRPSDAAPD